MNETGTPEEVPIDEIPILQLAKAVGLLRPIVNGTDLRLLAPDQSTLVQGVWGDLPNLGFSEQDRFALKSVPFYRRWKIPIRSC